jgi:ADP-ribose pyrophosphatase
MFESFTARSFAAMEKPAWRRRSSTYVIESEFMRLRSDEVELPDGTIIPAYYIREGNGFVIAVPLTPQREIVLVRQYRYGTDTVIIEFPAGTIDPGEDPLVCAKRELEEETGYTALRWEALMSSAAEPVRSNSICHMFIAHDAEPTSIQSLDTTEAIEPFTATLDEFHEMLRRGEIGAISSVAAGYAALDRLAYRGAHRAAQ